VETSNAFNRTLELTVRMQLNGEPSLDLQSGTACKKLSQTGCPCDSGKGGSVAADPDSNICGAEV
jgi:hypothetical protein